MSSIMRRRSGLTAFRASVIDGLLVRGWTSTPQPSHQEAIADNKRKTPASAGSFNPSRLTQIGKRSRGNVKEKWGKLTDDDLDVINGRREQLEGKLQERYGYAKDKIRKEVDNWYSAQRW